MPQGGGGGCMGGLPASNSLGKRPPPPGRNFDIQVLPIGWEFDIATVGEDQGRGRIATFTKCLGWGGLGKGKVWGSVWLP